MILETICTLKYGDNEKIIETGDEIKVFLENGEILIGDYQESDYGSLRIERGSDTIDIEFEQIKDIEGVN